MRKPRPRATAVDAHVGNRVRMRRTLLGLNQMHLGDALGISYQQVQKYEVGSNRIGASRLYELTKIFDVPVSYFYEDMPDEHGKSPRSARPPAGEDPELGIMNKRETLKLVRGYYQIEDGNIRTCVRELLRAVAAESEN